MISTNYLCVFTGKISFPISGDIFWPYFAAIVLLIIGLSKILRGRRRREQAIDKAVVFGPLFLAIPMGVFGADHFVAASSVAQLVPSWIPWHLFWTYFVGAALIASSLGIVAARQVRLAAGLLGIMILCFVLFIQVPNVIARPSERIFSTLVLRDLSFSGGAFALAILQTQESQGVVRGWMLNVVRLLIGIPAFVFGVEQLVLPEVVPIIPLARLTPAWVPGHTAMAYITGSILTILGICLVFKWKERLAAAWIGIVVFAVVVLVYLPIMAAAPSDVANGLNYVVDTLAFGGSALIVSEMFAKGNRSVKEEVDDALPERESLRRIEPVKDRTHIEVARAMQALRPGRLECIGSHCAMARGQPASSTKFLTTTLES